MSFYNILLITEYYSNNYRVVIHYDMTIECIPIIEYQIVAFITRQSKCINVIARIAISIVETSNGGYRNA